MTANQIQSNIVRAIVTGSATPCSDILETWTDLTNGARAEAIAYYGSVANIQERAKWEREPASHLE